MSAWQLHPVVLIKFIIKWARKRGKDKQTRSCFFRGLLRVALGMTEPLQDCTGSLVQRENYKFSMRRTGSFVRSSKRSHSRKGDLNNSYRPGVRGTRHIRNITVWTSREVCKTYGVARGMYNYERRTDRRAPLVFRELTYSYGSCVKDVEPRPRNVHG